MNLNYIRDLSEKYTGGLKKLSADIGMSEANLHRCINLNRIQASDLEKIAIKLNVDISLFFDEEAKINHSQQNNAAGTVNRELLQACKLLISNYQQRDKLFSHLDILIKNIK